MNSHDASLPALAQVGWFIKLNLADIARFGT